MWNGSTRYFNFSFENWFFRKVQFLGRYETSFLIALIPLHRGSWSRRRSRDAIARLPNPQSGSRIVAHYWRCHAVTSYCASDWTPPRSHASKFQQGLLRISTLVRRKRERWMLGWMNSWDYICSTQICWDCMLCTNMQHNLQRCMVKVVGRKTRHHIAIMRFDQAERVRAIM